jgi:CRISPR system Cascade subunit CasA
MNLLTYQCFAPTGRIGIANWHGEPTAGGGASKHAPCAPSSMVHALVLGRTLLETIHRNLLTREIVVDAYGVDGWGAPIWDRPISNRQDASALANASMTFLGRLVPISRSISLHDDGVQIILANGIDYPLFPAFREATATIIRRKEELALLPASTSRSLWRQLGAVAVTRRAHADAASGPLALRHEHPVSSTALWVGAFVTDKAKIDDVVEATYSVPSCMFEDFGRLAYEAGVEHAEQGEKALKQAVKTYATSLKVDAPAYDLAQRHFWTSVEQDLPSLFALAAHPDLATDIPASAWGKSVRSAAHSAYERSCASGNPRQIQAFALGLSKLTFATKASPPAQTTNA